MRTDPVFESVTSIEKRVMRTLHRRTRPLTAQVIGCLGKLTEPFADIDRALEYLRLHDFVARRGIDGDVPKWSLTRLGEQVIDEKCKRHPVEGDDLSYLTNCDDQMVCPPAAVTVCIDEDELDEWWEGLDVELKADAFLAWTLGRGRAAIPVEGAIGESRQKVLGEICGEVTNAAGIKIPGVNVTIMNAANSLTRVARTDVDGAYTFVLLPAGAYQIKFAVDGYRTLASELTLEAGRATVRNAVLYIGTTATMSDEVRSAAQ